VSSGHYLATAAAMRVLDAGGNAVDAGVTAAMALAVLQSDVVSFAGVAVVRKNWISMLCKECRAFSHIAAWLPPPWTSALEVATISL
jgi:hypothetical protein